jgi:hypothetical protein
MILIIIGMRDFLANYRASRGATNETNDTKNIVDLLSGFITLTISLYPC